MRILISAGEASGEAYGAELIQAMRSLAPDAEFFGLGGDRMRSAGCELVTNARDIAVVGLAEVVSHLPRIWGEFKKLVAAAEARRPDAAVLIDFPDFNFRLARRLHALGIPVFYYVSPQLWAWRRGRIKLVQKYVRKMLVIFPFEQDFYREHGVEVEFVGHPMAAVQPPAVSREEFAATVGADPSKPWIALLPGSRRKEVAMNLPTMLEAATRLGEGYEYILPVASTLSTAFIDGFTRDFRLRVVLTDSEHARGALHKARVAVVASGTATVEATLMDVPFVMVYRVSPLTYTLGRRLVSVPHFAMPNLIADREVIPELVQHDFTAEKIVSWMNRLLPDGKDRTAMLGGLAEIRARLRGGVSGNASTEAAKIVLRDLGVRATVR